MENSSNLRLLFSSRSEKLPCPSQESGWSLYIEDFIAAQNYKESTSNNDGSSVISDAASCAGWRSSAFFKPSNCGENLRFKRRKARGGELDDHDDDPLEDTASSPVNSPQVIDLNDPLDMSAKNKEDTRESTKENVGYVNCGELKSSEIVEMSLSERRFTCTELRKRGLCLVPVSMLIDYL